MLQILPIALTHVKADNNSQNLLNEFRQIVLFFVSMKRKYDKIVLRSSEKALLYQILVYIIHRTT